MYVVVVHVIVALQIHDLLHACSVYTRRIRPSYNCSEVVEEEVRRQTGWDWLKEELEVTVTANGAATAELMSDVQADVGSLAQHPTFT